MKSSLQVLALLLLWLLSYAAPLHAATFTTGNLVVYRVGNGSGSLLNTGNPVFLDEYTPAGVLVQSVAMPTVLSGANKILVASGTAATEGMLTRSADGQYLIATGYNAPLPTTGIASTTSAAVNRVIGRVKYDGTVNTSTGLTDASDGGNVRSATSVDGTSFWTTGDAGGIRFALPGATTSTPLESTIVKFRQPLIFGGQLYVSGGSSTFPRIATVGSGTPATAGQSVTSLPGFPITGSPNSFFLADLNAGVAGFDTLYVADDAAGLLKYSLAGGAWTANGTIGTALDLYRGLTAKVSGTTVTLYLTRKGGTTATGGGELASLVDSSGYNATITGTPTLVVTAGANKAFRGIALAPVAAVALTAPTITGQPANQYIESGTTATLTVVASGNPLPTFQWYQGTSPSTATPISGATSATYTTPVLTSAASYWVRVSNSQGVVNSNTAVITMFTGNPNLTAIGLSAGTLTPAFAAATTTYTADVVGYISSIIITPTAAITNSSITIDGVPVTSGTASSPFALSPGSNTFTIFVAAGDGTRTKTYLVTVKRAPFYTQSDRNVTTTHAGAEWNPAGVTLNGMQFINLGLQGMGRIAANSKDPVTGESIGSISDLQISGWTRNVNGSYSGTFHMLPDHGYTGTTVVVSSNYAARINQFGFTFTPYTSAGATAAQNQIAMSFNGSTRFTYDHDGNAGTPAIFTTGLTPTGAGVLFSTAVPVVTTATTQSDGSVSGRLSIHTEGLALDKRVGKTGGGWLGDEDGAHIYHFNSSKRIDGLLAVPAALVPHSPVGTINFVADPPVSGRRINQGFEGLTQSPDGTKLFALLQTATLQDSANGNDGRSNVRMLVYDVSATDTPGDPVQQYVIQLPRLDTNGDGIVDRTAAQSSILALNDHQLLVLPRDNLGRGGLGSPVFKSVILVDLSTGTNIDGIYDAEGSAVAPGGSLTAGVTDVSWTEAINIIGKLDPSLLEIAKFGLNLNLAPGDANTLSEKWEALAIMPAYDSVNPNDFFLFVGNDNDFQSSTGAYMLANGALQSYDSGLSNDTIVLAYRVRILAPGIALQAWRSANFGTTATNGNLADTADYDSDGLKNILEFALGTDPKASGPTPWTTDIETISPDRYLRLAVPKNFAASELTYVIEASPNLSPLSWTPAIVESNTATQLIARDSVKISGTARRFMRLRVTQP